MNFEEQIITHSLMPFTSPLPLTRCGTDNVQGQISEHIFAPKMEAILFIILKIIRNARGFENWIYPSFSWGIVSHMTRFNQSYTSGNVYMVSIYFTL